jgi:proteasome lid subunit RPN8/RPN11
MTITIPRAELSRLHAHAEEGFPHEVVGILAGTRADNTVTRVAVLVNERADSAHNRYTVSGLALARAEQKLVDEGLEIVGYYHSHPDHPAQYSDFDRDHAWPNMSYVIVSVLAGRASTTLSWRLRDDRSAMDAEPISIVED